MKRLNINPPPKGPRPSPPPAPPRKRHQHYFKECPYTHIDIYRLLLLFEVDDPCIQHAVKKLLVAGGRGAGKNITQDVQEAIDTMQRWLEMRIEDEEVGR